MVDIPQHVLIEHFRLRLPARELAARYECSGQLIYKRWHALGLFDAVDRALLDVPKNEPPPSLAMIRLAEFDPIVMRALKLRMGEPAELPTESL